MDDQFIIVTRSVLVPGSLTINVFELGWILQKNFSLFSNFWDYFFCKILYTVIRRVMPSFVMFLW